MVVRGVIFGVFGGARTVGGSYALLALFLVPLSLGEDFFIEAGILPGFLGCRKVMLQRFVYALTLGF